MCAQPMQISELQYAHMKPSEAATGSYIGSVMNSRSRNYRRPSLTLHAPPSPSTEKKLTRTRKMSEAIRTPSSENLEKKSLKLMRIPTEVGDITKEWAKIIVNQYLMKEDRDVLANGVEDIVNFKVSDCKNSSGDFSCTYSMEVTFTAEGGDPEGVEFIVKLLPADDTGRVYVFESNLLEKEIEVYFEVLPSLRQFLRGQKSGDHSAIVDFAVPECVYGSHNMDGAGALVFRSCRGKGYAHCANPAGLSEAELMIAVKTIAQFHATGRALIAKNSMTAVRKRYPYLTKDMYSNGLLIAEVNEQLDTYEDLLNHAPEAETRQARSVFKKLKTAGAFTMLKDLRRPGPDTLTTIIHGELWESNILFRETDSRCKILDWKNAQIASGTLDLAFLLFSSTNNETIRSCWEKVLAEYHSTFCATLDQLEPACTKPTLNEVKEDYYESLRASLLHAICMFVQQMEYLERRTTSLLVSGNKTEEFVELAARLKIYEKRAIELLNAVDLESLPDLGLDDNLDEADLQDEQLLPGDIGEARKINSKITTKINGFH